MLRKIITFNDSQIMIKNVLEKINFLVFRKIPCLPLWIFLAFALLENFINLLVFAKKYLHAEHHFVITSSELISLQYGAYAQNKDERSLRSSYSIQTCHWIYFANINCLLYHVCQFSCTQVRSPDAQMFSATVGNFRLIRQHSISQI